MTDTVRTKSALQALLADNTTGLISPQDIRDFLVSVYPMTEASTHTDVNNAIDTATTAGGTVALASGTVAVSSPVVPKTNVILRGQGKGATTMQLAASAGGKVVYQASGGLNSVRIADMTLDGNGSNQSDGATRNDGAVAHITNVTDLTLSDLIVKNARSGGGLLITDCNDVKLNRLRMLTNGKSATSGFESDHTYIGDCYNVQVTDYYALTCTDTGLAVEGCQYVTIEGIHILGCGAGSQCLAFSTSPGGGTPNPTDYVSVHGGVLVGSGGTTLGVRIGRFDEASGQPTNIVLSNLNISAVDIGIAVDEGDRVDIANCQIKLDASATNYIGYRLGAGSTLVNITGGRVQNAVTGVQFVSGCGAPIISGVDFSACLAPYSGTPPAGTKVTDCKGWVTQKSGATSVADGGTISHGLTDAPTRVTVTPSVSGELVSVTAIGATTFTVAIKTHAGAAGTTQTVYWEAEKVY